MPLGEAQCLLRIKWVKWGLMMHCANQATNETIRRAADILIFHCQGRISFAVATQVQRLQRAVDMKTLLTITRSAFSLNMSFHIFLFRLETPEIGEILMVKLRRHVTPQRHFERCGQNWKLEGDNHCNNNRGFDKEIFLRPCRYLINTSEHIGSSNFK